MLLSSNPRSGRNPKDTHHRAGRLRKIHSELYRFGEIPKEGIFPGFDPLPNLRYEYIGVLLPQEDIQQFVLKLARGLALKLEDLYLGENLEIHFCPFEANGDAWINDILSKTGVTHEWGKS
jgi:hypothetical protein